MFEILQNMEKVYIFHNDLYIPGLSYIAYLHSFSSITLVETLSNFSVPDSVIERRPQTPKGKSVLLAVIELSSVRFFVPKSRAPLRIRSIKLALSSGGRARRIDRIPDRAEDKKASWNWKRNLAMAANS